jgi:hypothetical protein
MIGYYKLYFLGDVAFNQRNGVLFGKELYSTFKNNAHTDDLQTLINKVIFESYIFN